MDQDRLYEDGIEEASRGFALFENAVIVATIGAGAWGMRGLVNPGGVPLLSILYALFLIVSLGFVLRKHLCTHCHYHGKWCHCGWGALAARLGYAKDSGNERLGAALAGITWAVLMGGPIVAMVVGGLVCGFSLELGISLGAFAVLVAVNFGLHLKDCKSCKMRFICKLSAAKKP